MYFDNGSEHVETNTQRFDTDSFPIVILGDSEFASEFLENPQGMFHRY